MHFVLAAGVRFGLVGLLAVASTATLAAGPKLGGAAATTAARAVDSAPTTRLIVRYKTAVKMAGQGGVTLATERREAAMRVARTAQLSGLPLLEYVKSVSPSLHVVALPQPLSPAATQAAIQRLREDEGVADVAIDHRMKPHWVPNDPRFRDGAQWHLMNSASVPGGINAASAWDFSSASGVVVAVLDGGYRPHADLATNVLPGYDFVSAESPNASTTVAGFPFWTANDGDARESNAQDPGDWVDPVDVAAGYCDLAEPSTWHGTHVAGIVAAVGKNARDGLGVAYNARILPVRVLGRCGGFLSDILAGARWAAGLGVPGVPPTTTPAKILNLSLGSQGTCNSITQSEIDAILASNVSIIASAGNESSIFVSLPANCRGVVAVTAHTREGDNADYANVGVGVAISAPGGGLNSALPTLGTGIRGVLSTWNTGTTVPGSDALGLLSGTSMAAPQVSGVLALLASLRPDLPMSTLEGNVIRAIRPFPAGSYCATNPQQLPAGFCGSGLLDAQLAVEAVRPVAPDLVVVQNPISAYPVSGDVYRYSITVRNVGRETATFVQLSATLSAGMEVESILVEPSDAVRSFSANTISATLVRLLPGQALTITVNARIANASAVLTSTVNTSTTGPAEFSTANNRDVLLLPIPPVFPPDPVTGGGGGGGCTAAPDGQADAGLPLLALLAALVLFWRRRRPAA